MGIRFVDLLKLVVLLFGRVLLATFISKLFLRESSFALFRIMAGKDQVLMRSALFSAARQMDAKLKDLFGPSYIALTRDITTDERLRFAKHSIESFSSGRSVAVLDVGCGGGTLLDYLTTGPGARLSSYLGVDINAPKINATQHRKQESYRYREVDLRTDWHFGEFDAVVCLEVIEHIKNDDIFFRRLCGHVKPGGILILSTPGVEFIKYMSKFIQGLDYVSPTEDGGHVRMGYDKDSLSFLAKNSGMEPAAFFRISPFTPSQLRTFRRWAGHPRYLFYNILLNRFRKREPFCRDSGDVTLSRSHYCIGAVFTKPDDSGKREAA